MGVNRLAVRWITTLVAGTVVLLSVGTGCGTPAATPGDSQNPATASPTFSASPSPTEPAFSPTAGPITATFDTSERLASVQQIDPATGSTTELFNLANLDQDATPTFNPALTPVHLGGWIYQQLFDPTMQRMAINWTDPSDGSRHVGWIDTEGTVTDATAELSSSSSDFAARPQHQNALFDESGNFVYVDITTGTLARIDPNTFEEVGKPVKVENQYGNIPIPIMLQPDGSADSYQSDRLYDTGMVVEVSMPAGPSIFSFSDAAIADIFGSKKILASTGKALKVMSASELKQDDYGDYGTEDTSSIPAITPKTDYSIDVATISSDEKSIAFSASRGENRALFLMTLGDSADPSKLVTLGPLDRLLFWL